MTAPDRGVERPRSGQWRVASAEAMAALGACLGSVLDGGDVVLLDGVLGAGKTTLTRGIAAGLGVDGPVTSPTFVIAREHPPTPHGPGLVHVDAYRLAGPEEVEDLDLGPAMARSVTVVEWAAGVAEHLTADRLELVLEVNPDESRTVRWRVVGERWTQADLSRVAGCGVR